MEVQHSNGALFMPCPSGGAPKGSIHLLEEFSLVANTAKWQIDWIHTYLSNAEQAVGIIE